ncbi:hypothetical protein GTP58_13255 [Duganella sp. CY15W]|uniref:hypothetical protein n=1 Tax=Duganella sp. CY15W TaxID=2692172 RepID=UPI00136D70F3|nr:hypothetical protein [Duganella sp. CY15W]MYM29291.1 hypothetical protein [Duganella sp. CY15W]
MLAKLYETYKNCHNNHLKVAVSKLEEPAEKRWEKTVEALYMRAADPAFVAPLVNKQEAYGDLLASFRNMRWALIEFKIEEKACSSERDKYLRTNPKKYNGNAERSKIKESYELEMFESFINEIESAQAAQAQQNNPEGSVSREPHFLVFGPPKSQNLTSFKDLAAKRYWGAWATEEQPWTQKSLKDVPVDVAKIPELSAVYEEFVCYAGCVKLAKSGVFSVKEGEDGKGSSLQDLSVVIGLSSEGVEIVTTMENFLAAQQLEAENLLKNEALPPPPSGHSRKF